MSACVWKRIDRLIEPTTSQRRLDATDIPAPGFVQAFCASQQLSQQLAQERHFNANGQAAYLKKKQQQLAYVEEAHRREQPPLETVAAPEIMRGELRRDAVFHHGAAGVPAPLTGPAALDLTDLRGGGVPIVKVGNEALACREKRLERQKDFLASRKVRHDQALEEFQRALDVLSEECQQEVFAATERVKKDLEEKIAESNAILKPLEPPPLPERPEGEEPLVLDETTLLDELHDLPLDGTIDPAKAKAVAAENAALKALRSLGERTEGEVRGILAAVEASTESRKQRISAFAGADGELARIDGLRKSKMEELLKTLVEALTAAAHVVHGEAERIVEGHALSFDEVLLDNRKAMNQLEAKLTVQALEDNKDYKVRWHKGLLLWKQQRHRHSMAVVMRRIRSNEFRQPDSLVEAVAKVREHQAFVFLQRRDLMEELFCIPQNRLTVAAVRQLEEQNTQLNDRAQETFDTLLVELRELREALNVSAEQMLGELGLELEVHDARQEWKGHDSVANLIDAEVRPPLRECLDPVAEMLQLLSNKLTHQEEALHLAVTGVITFFSNLAKRQELLKKRVEEFEVNYNGEVEDCEKDFEDTCERNENKMKELHTAIDDAAHHETLEELKQETFDHLDQMAVGYRDYADQLLGIHQRYPGDAQALIRKETRGYCQDLGLALDPAEETVALKAERAAHAAQLEADAIAAAEAAHAAPDGEDEAAKEARLQALAAAIETAKTQLRQDAEAREAEAVEAEAAAFEGLEEKSLWVSAEDVPLGEGTGCKVLEKKSLPELRGTVLQEHPIDGPSDADGAPDGTAAAADGADDGATDGSDAEPVFADGTRALETLSFDHSWFEENLYGLREAIFQNLQTQKRYLDRVDIPAACEEVRRDLDQRLRRHTNRKGEVQVEWYVPRYGTVSKHKDKFERHLISVAHKCQDQDDAVEKALEEVEKAEEEFKQRLVSLQDRLSEAETLPVLTSFERQASDLLLGFKDFCKSAVKTLLELSSKAPQALQKDNQAFLMMCKKGEEQYSEPEIVYYGGEIQELNSTLDERMQERAQKAHDLEAAVDEKCKAPMHTFSEAYAAAVESLCASKGYGRKYGEPRRKAQERVRTLIARAKTVGSNVELLLDYVKKLLALPLEDGGLEMSAMPPPPRIMSIRHFFERGGETWSFPSEALGVLYVAVCTMAELGTHLGAFKEAYVSKYELAAVPWLRILREDACLMPPAEQQQEAHRKAEAAKKALSENSAENEAEAESAIQLSRSLEASSALRDDSLLRVLGPLMKSEKFNDEIQLVIKASHEAYAGQASFVATGLSRVCAGFLFVGQAATKLAKVENRLLH
ncbi:Zinc finger CCCH domain-containing protein 6 [Durusdinium trenchii]|uniref:Zinc finger CCCH domain-containing protein 6 n=1 Tax=Durusdinium trenchii TaxID=1381693 RepID=A0ABP0H8J4_9DINO